MDKEALAEKLQRIENILRGAIIFVEGIHLMLKHPDPSYSDALHLLSKDMDDLKKRLGYARDQATEIQRLIMDI